MSTILTRSVDPGRLLDLSGKVALVTGAGGHLGSAIADRLCKAGATVWLTGRDITKLEAVRSRLASAAGTCRVLELDITVEKDRRNAVAKIAEDDERLHILVNNAYRGNTGTLETAEAEDYERAYQVAISAPAMMLKDLTGLLEASATAQSMASVVNVSSMYGFVSPDPSIYGDTGHNSPPHYGAAKGALIQLTRYAAVHLASRNIRVNCVSPGPFPKPRVAETMPELWETLNAKTPLKRVGVPDEMANAVLFLASDAASYITGVNLPVDGGWTAW